MFDIGTWIGLACGSVARIPALCIQGHRSGCKVWKVFPLTFLLTVFELIGTMILFLVENGIIGGISYFGGILLLPVFCVGLAWLFRIPYMDLMDMTATGAGAMLAVMRVQCLNFGCCGGKILFSTTSGKEIRFPSQLTELVSVLIIMVVLLIVGKNRKKRGKLYPMYLIIYGVIRFSINWFREGITPFVWVLPAGNFWSLVAIVYGSTWLMILKNREKKEHYGL